MCSPPCQGGGRGFKSRQARPAPVPAPPGEVAQLAEHAAENRGVGGSIPSLATGVRRPPSGPASAGPGSPFLGP
jgi:hypothetical protein